MGNGDWLDPRSVSGEIHKDVLAVVRLLAESGWRLRRQGHRGAMTMDQTFEVRLRLKALSEGVEDSLVEQLDAFVSRFSGVPYVTILQDAPGGIEAARRLLGRLKDFGCEVVSIDPDFVTRTEIAERLGASRQAVSHWVAGQRQVEFPFPLPSIQAGISLWCWSDIVNWARESKHLADEDDVCLLSADEMAVVNGELAAGRMPVFA